MLNKPKSARKPRPSMRSGMKGDLSKSPGTVDEINTDRDSIQSINIQTIISPKAMPLLSVKNLRAINPDEWNNVPIPVTSSIKTIVAELTTACMKIQ